jgi:hypothetical protein
MSATQQPPPAPRKRKNATSDDDDEHNIRFSFARKRLDFSNEPFLQLKQMKHHLSNLLYLKNRDNIMDFILDLTYSDKLSSVIDSTLIAKIINSDFIDVWNIIYKHDFWIINSYYQSIFENCELDKIKQIIELGYLDLIHVSIRYNRNLSTIIYEILFDSCKFDIEKADFLTTYYDEFVTAEDLMLELTDVGIINSIYNFINTELFHNNNLAITAKQFIDIHNVTSFYTARFLSIKQIINVIININFKLKQPFITIETFTKIFNNHSMFEMANMDTNISDIINKIVTDTYNIINTQTVEYLTQHYNKIRAYTILSTRWLDCMFNTKYIYGRLKRLEEFENLFPSTDTTQELTELIRVRETLPAGAKRHQTWLQLVDLINKHFPLSKFT